MVLAPGQTAKDLPPQQELKITDYATVHKSGDTGAYVAEVISSQCNIEQSGSVWTT